MNEPVVMFQRHYATSDFNLFVIEFSYGAGREGGREMGVENLLRPNGPTLQSAMIFECEQLGDEQVWLNLRN
jgi:hypothetical protein